MSAPNEKLVSVSYTQGHKIYVSVAEDKGKVTTIVKIAARVVGGILVTSSGSAEMVLEDVMGGSLIIQMPEAKKDST